MRTVSLLERTGALAALAWCLCGAMAVSCTGTAEIAEEGRVTVVFTAGVDTRAAVTDHEDAVESLDLLAFRADDGALDAHVRATGSRAVSADLTSGAGVNYYLVANAPEGLFGMVADEGGFLSARTSLAHSTARSLVMSGKGSLSVSKGLPSVSVDLSRYVSKVSVETFSMGWGDAFSYGTVTLGRIALINAVGDIPLSGVPDAGGDLWYNRMGVEPVTGENAGVVANMLMTDCGMNLSSSSTVSLSCDLYTMPNPSHNSINSAERPGWSVRNTRLAVEVIVGGVSNWYCVDLPDMKPNTHYVVRSFRVQGPGSLNPDTPLDRKEVELTVEVKPWEDNNIDVSL